MAISAKQQEALRFINQEGSIACLVGTIRSGKTYIATLAFGLLLATETKSYLHLLCGRKLKVMEQEILPALKDAAMMSGKSYEYSRSAGIVSYGQQRIVVAAGNDDRSLDRIQGLTAKHALIDEATLLPESFFNTSISRLSYGDSKSWICCNPSYPLHYIKKEWIDKNLVDKHLNFTFLDNPSLSQNVIDRYNAMFTGVFRKRMVEGLWSASDGLVYNDYTIGERPKGRVIRCDAGMDYGISSPNAVIPIETIRAGKETHYHIPSELYIDGGSQKRNLTDKQIAQKVVPYLNEVNASTISLDPSALSMRNELMQYQGRDFVVKRAKNDVEWGLKVSGGVLAHKKITISPECKRLIEELQSYSWDPDKEDTVIKRNDHACDAMRYVMMDRFSHLFAMSNRAIPIPEGF